MSIHKIGVVGAGQMGAGIAQAAATAGYFCVVTDARNDALVCGAKSVEKSLAKFESKGLIANKKEIFERIHWHADVE